MASLQRHRNVKDRQGMITLRTGQILPQDFSRHLEKIEQSLEVAGKCANQSGSKRALMTRGGGQLILRGRDLLCLAKSVTDLFVVGS